MCSLLGDDPPRDRTAELRVLGFPGRHLGPIQMTTDTALGVTKLVVTDKSAWIAVTTFPERIFTDAPRRSASVSNPIRGVYTAKYATGML